AEALPGFHLTLVAARRDLQAPVDFREGMHREGRKALAVEDRLRPCGRKRLTMGIRAQAERGHDTDAGADVVVRVHVPSQLKRSKFHAIPDGKRVSTFL